MNSDRTECLPDALRLAPQMIWKRELAAYRIQNTKEKKVPECLKIKALREKWLCLEGWVLYFVTFTHTPVVLGITSGQTLSFLLFSSLKGDCI